VVAPRAIIERYGADTVRLFSLFAAPPEKDLDWNEKGVEGCHRFVLRVWRLLYQYQSIFETPSKEKVTPSDAALVGILRKTHWMIQKFNEDIENNKFNTAISASMELVNEIYGVMETNSKVLQTEEGKAVLRESLSSLILCLSPFTPHLSEELWQITQAKTLASESTFPTANVAWLKSDTFTLVVQVNGKLRDKIEINKSQTADEIKSLVVTLPKVAPYLEGKQLKQVVYVPERLANIVVVG
jgi:leucyl-tRNA synthetase